MATKTGNVEIPGALIAIDDKGVVAYAGDIHDELSITTVVNGVEETQTVEKSQHEINQEFQEWKESVIVNSDDPSGVDWTDYYNKGTVDSKLNNKLDKSSLITNNVNFSIISVNDDYTVPSMRVFKTLVPQVISSGDVTHAISSYGIANILSSNIGIAYNKVLYATDVISLIDAAAPKLAQDYGDFIHLSGSRDTISLGYFKALIYGQNAMPNGSIMDTISAAIAEDSMHTYVIPTSSSYTEISMTQEESDAMISAISVDFANNKPFVVFIKDSSDETAIIANTVHGGDDDFYFYAIDTENSLYISINIWTGNAEIRVSTLYEHYGRYNDNTIYLRMEGNSYVVNSDIDTTFRIAANNYVMPILHYDNTYYYPIVFRIKNNISRIIFTNTITKQVFDLSFNLIERTVTITNDSLESLLDDIIADVVFDADTIIEDGERITDTKSLRWFIEDLYDKNTNNDSLYISQIYLGGNAITKNAIPNSTQQYVDLGRTLPNFYLPDDTAAMLSALSVKNEADVLTGDNYKYDFNGSGTIDSAQDYQAYLALRENLVLEVNGLRRKLDNINVGTTYVSQGTFDTLAGKVYAGLYGNSTGVSNLTDNAKLQSLKEVVDFIGTKKVGTFTLSNEINAAISEAYTDFLGVDRDNGVVELSDDNVNKGLKFNDNLAALGKIVVDEGYMDVSGYTQELGISGTQDANTSTFDYLIRLNDDAIPSAGSVITAIMDATGYIPGDDPVLTQVSTITGGLSSRIGTLEAFKTLYDESGLDFITLAADVDSMGNALTSLGASKKGLNGIHPFKGMLFSINESNVVEDESPVLINSADDIYYSNTHGRFVVDGKDSYYYTNWMVGSDTIFGNRTDLERSKYGDPNVRAFYYDISSGNIYVNNPSCNVDIREELEELRPYLLPDISTLLSRAENAAGAATIVDTPEGSSIEQQILVETNEYGRLDLTPLASRNYVDGQIANVNSLTGEEIVAIRNAVGNLNGYATTDYVNTKTSGMVKKVKFANTVGEPDSSGQVWFTSADLTTILNLDSYLKTGDTVPWGNISGKPNLMTSDDVEQLILSHNYTSNTGTITGVKVDGSVKSSGVADVGYILKGISYSINGGSETTWRPNLNNGIFNLGNIVSSIPDPSFIINFNGQEIRFEDGKFDLGEGYINNELLIPRNYNLATNEITGDYLVPEETLITAEVLQAVVGYFLMPEGDGYVGRDPEEIPVQSGSRIGDANDPIKVSPNSVYRWTTPVGAIYAGLISTGNIDTAAIYTLRFRTSTTFNGVIISVLNPSGTSVNTNATIYSQGNVGWLYDTEYEVSILYDGSSYTVKATALTANGSNGKITL